MPYVITTHSLKPTIEGMTTEHVQRRAVATLEEVRTIPVDTPYGEASLERTPDDGTATFPWDDFTITVEPVMYSHLCGEAARAGRAAQCGPALSNIIDAYNAAQGD